MPSLNFWLSQARRRLFPGETLATRLARGAFWSLVGTLMLQALRMAAGVVTARILGRSVYGEYGMLNNTVGTFGLFAGLGLGITATKYVAEFRAKAPARAGRIIGLTSQTALVSGGLVAVIVILAAEPLASKTLNAPHLTALLRVGCAVLFFNALGGVQVGALAGLEAYRAIARVSTLAGVLSFPLLIVGTWLWSLPGAVVATAATAAGACVLNWRALRRECAVASVPISYGGAALELPIVWSYSVPALLSGVVVAGATWACNTILVRQPSGYAEMGIIGAATALRNLTMLVPRAVFTPLLPILSSELNRDDGVERNDRLHVINAYATWYATTALTALLLFLVKPLMLLYGRDFVAGSTAVVLVLCCIPIMTYTDGVSRLLQAKALLWYGIVFNTLWGAVLLTTMHFLAARGAVGLGIAYLVAYIVAVVVMFPVYYRRLEMSQVVSKDLLLGGLLTLALLPGVVCQLLAWPVGWALVGAVGTLVVLAIAGWLVRGWLRQ